MAKLWNVGRGVGDQLHVPTVKRRDLDGKVKEFVRIPSAYTGPEPQYVEHKAGNVYVSLPGFGFWTVPKDAPFDVPYGASVKAVQNMCPHLVTQEEFESMQSPDSAPTEEPKAEAKPDKGKKQN